MQLDLKFKRRGSLQVFLTSPKGTESTIIPKRRKDVFPDVFRAFTVNSVQFWGEDPFGTWTLKFKNFDYDHYYTGKY